MPPNVSLALPPRLAVSKVSLLLVTLPLFMVLAWSFVGAGVSPVELIRGLPHMVRLLDEMTPPDFSRFGLVARALLTTMQMAVVGAAIGIVFSLLLSVFAARNLAPSRASYHFSRTVIALFRTVPDLVWAIFFVATVGLGPFAGTLTIIVDTIGFCGRFFAEAIEEVEAGPQEALAALGAGRIDTFFAALFPAILPSLTNSSLFSLEKAVRSSVILGLVGAGGIGIELKVAMDMFLYAEAATIIILVFALVLAVERLSTRIRQRVL